MYNIGTFLILGNLPETYQNNSDMRPSLDFRDNTKTEMEVMRKALVPGLSGRKDY